MSEERLRELEDKYEGFKVYDNRAYQVGKVDDLFVDETGREEYVGVRTGLLGLRSTLIPMDIVRVDEAGRIIEVSESKETIKDAPTLDDDDDDVTPEYEDRIRSHFGLESLNAAGRGSYGAYSGGTSAREDRTGTGEREDTEPLGETEDHGQRASSEASPQETGREGGAEPLQESRDEEDPGIRAGQRPEGAKVREQGGVRTRVRRRVRIEEEYDEESGPR